MRIYLRRRLYAKIKLLASICPWRLATRFSAQRAERGRWEGIVASIVSNSKCKGRVRASKARRFTSPKTRKKSEEKKRRLYGKKRIKNYSFRRLL